MDKKLRVGNEEEPKVELQTVTQMSYPAVCPQSFWGWWAYGYIQVL